MVQLCKLVDVVFVSDHDEAQCDQEVAVTFDRRSLGQELLEQQACDSRYRDGQTFDLQGRRRLQERQGAEDEQRKLRIFKHICVSRIFNVGIHADEVDLEALVADREPNRRFVRGSGVTTELTQTALHCGMTLHGDADVHILRDDQRGRSVGLEQIRYLGADDQDPGFLENRLCRP